jgi:hypothetical protein
LSLKRSASRNERYSSGCGAIEEEGTPSAPPHTAAMRPTKGTRGAPPAAARRDRSGRPTFSGPHGGCMAALTMGHHLERLAPEVHKLEERGVQLPYSHAFSTAARAVSTQFGGAILCARCGLCTCEPSMLAASLSPSLIGLLQRCAVWGVKRAPASRPCPRRRPRRSPTRAPPLAPPPRPPSPASRPGE